MIFERYEKISLSSSNECAKVISTNLEKNQDFIVLEGLSIFDLENITTVKIYDLQDTFAKLKND